MSPSVLRRTGPDFEKDGQTVTPRALVSTCEVEGCERHAPFGFMVEGKYLTYCAEHKPSDSHKEA